MVTTTYAKATLPFCTGLSPVVLVLLNSGVKVGREVEHFERGTKHLPSEVLRVFWKLFPQKGGSVEARSQMWGLQAARGAQLAGTPKTWGCLLFFL